MKIDLYDAIDASPANTTQGQPAHSKIGASSMYRWSECPGSVALSETLPKASSSSYAEEGTLAHEIAAQILDNGQLNPELMDDPRVTLEMLEAVDVYVNYVINILTKDPTAILHVEHTFEMGKIYPNLYGTTDTAIYHRNLKLLRIIDYKHGAGIPVEIKNNSQLRYYGLGALTTLGYPCTDIELTIVQPRCFHVDGSIRSETISIIEMLDFQSDLIKFAKATEVPNAPLKAGDHCRFCPAHAVCPELYSKAQELAIKEFTPMLTKDEQKELVKGYDPKKLSNALEWLPRIDAWTSAVREFAYSEALQGRTPPGHKLVDKQARRKLTDEPGMLKFFKSIKIAKTKLFDAPKIKGVTELDKLLKGSDKSVFERFNKFFEKKSTGTTLVPMGDKRLEIKNDPADDFEKIEDKSKKSKV